MSKQLGFGFADTGARLDPMEVPAPKIRKAQPFTPHPKGKLLMAGDEVTIIHRLGTVKRVRFSMVVGGRVHVAWPVANEPMAISVRTGRVVTPRSLSEWRLEPNALEMARVARKITVLEQKIAIE